MIYMGAKLIQSCPTLRPHGLQPARLPSPWDSPSKNTGVGCHALLQYIYNFFFPHTNAFLQFYCEAKWINVGKAVDSAWCIVRDN